METITKSGFALKSVRHLCAVLNKTFFTLAGETGREALLELTQRLADGCISAFVIALFDASFLFAFSKPTGLLPNAIGSVLRRLYLFRFHGLLNQLHTNNSLPTRCAAISNSYATW